MIQKIHVVMFGVVLSVIFLFESIACAEQNGAYCTGVEVLAAGATSTSKVILAKHSRTDCGTNWPQNTPRWFALNDNTSDAMLAAALTAQTSKMKVVLVPMAGSFPEWSILAQVYTQQGF